MKASANKEPSFIFSILQTMYLRPILFLCLIAVCFNVQSQQIDSICSSKWAISNAAVAKEKPIVTGAERLMYVNKSQEYWALLTNKRVGVVANQSSLVGSTHLVDTLLSCGVKIQTIFCPEHGFRGQAEAGASVGDETLAQIPVVSLYGKNKKPTSEQMRNIDVMVFDLQDVGVRFYTYISTLHYVMEACAEKGIPLLVLDRPNPNGWYVDGPVLEPQYRSFVGMHPVPIVYGMTIGEYAMMVNGEGWLHPVGVSQGTFACDLHVVPLSNYTHRRHYNLPVAPSPNLPTAQSVALYPSLCLFEGTNISVGRGTDTPFEIVGAPQYHHTKADSLSPCTFTPRSIIGVSENPPFKGKSCNGINLHTYPVKGFSLTFLIIMYKGTPHDTFFLKNGFVDKLAGTATLRQQLQRGATEQEIRSGWEPQLSHFKSIRKKYLLYGD